MGTLTHLPRDLRDQDRAKEQRLRGLVAEYLRGDTDLDEFEDRFVAASWDVHQYAGAVQQVAYKVEHRLAEYHEGLTDEAGLRDELRSVLGLVWHASGRPTASNIAVTVQRHRGLHRLVVGTE